MFSYHSRHLFLFIFFSVYLNVSLLRTVNDAGRINCFNRHSNTQWHGGIRVDEDFVLSVYVTSQIRFNQVANPFRFFHDTGTFF